MSIQENHFGHINQYDSEGNLEKIDVGALVRRLILFEKCSLVSVKFREIPTLVRIFGVHGVRRLLDEPGFEIIDDNLATGTLNLTPELYLPGFESAGKAVGNHVVVSVSSPRDPSKYPDEVTSRLESLEISGNKSKKLRAKLLEKSKLFPIDVSQASIDDFRLTMDSDHALVLATLRQVLGENPAIPGTEKLRIEVTKSIRFDGAYEVETNLTSEFNFDEVAAHELVSKALRGMSSMGQRIRLMSTLNAMTGFRDEEKPFFESRLSNLLVPLDPGVQEGTFTRVIELGGWPSLDSLDDGAEIDMGKLLAIRNHPDCVDLRQWFREVRAKSDDEVIDQFPSVKEKLSHLAHGRIVTGLRFVATNLADLDLVPLVGKAVNLADKFLFDKFLRDSNPVCLLSRNYPSIFE